MMRETIMFLRGEVAASNQARKKTLPTWKQQETMRKQNFDKKGDFRNQQRSEQRRDRFTLLTKSPKEILALDKGKFKAPPPIQIEELIKAGKLSHVIKELKQGSRKDVPKSTKKGEASRKDKALAISMVQPWQRAVPSTAHGMLKFPIPGGILTLRSSKIIPIECMMVSVPEAQPAANTRVTEERIKVAIHPEYP
ncbi:hypothetical protein Tco_1327697 [Tanacetum coccineum]